MSATRKLQRSGLDRAIIGAVQRCHGLSARSVPLEDILAELRARKLFEPSRYALTLHLRGLVERGILQTSGAGWRKT